MSKIHGEGKAIEKNKQLIGAVFSRLFIPTISIKLAEDYPPKIVCCSQG